MKIEKVKFDKINPAKYNPRVDLKPGDLEYEKLKKSIEEFGFVEPLVWNQKTGNLVGGHQRFKILKGLGYNEADVSIVDLGETKEKALNVALNKIEGDWDNEALTEILQELEAEGIADLTGFDDNEIESLVSEFEIPEEEPEYDESISDDVKTATCPECNYEFPI